MELYEGKSIRYEGNVYKLEHRPHLTLLRGPYEYGFTKDGVYLKLDYNVMLREIEEIDSMEENNRRIEDKVDMFYELLNAMAIYYHLSREEMLDILDALQNKWKY